MTPEATAYIKHKNLKIAAEEIGLKWQTLYYRLKIQGVPVNGDKSRYGSDKDKLADYAEKEFKRLVPAAQNMNDIAWQHGYDFSINGLKIDVKSSRERHPYKRSKSTRWSFSLKKQTYIANFVCCFCLDDNYSTKLILLIPSELFSGLQTISVASSGNSKWLDFVINETDLSEFFLNYDC